MLLLPVSSKSSLGNGIFFIGFYRMYDETVNEPREVVLWTKIRKVDRLLICATFAVHLQMQENVAHQVARFILPRLTSRLSIYA